MLTRYKNTKRRICNLNHKLLTLVMLTYSTQKYDKNNFSKSQKLKPKNTIYCVPLGELCGKVYEVCKDETMFSFALFIIPYPYKTIRNFIVIFICILYIFTFSKSSAILLTLSIQFYMT